MNLAGLKLFLGLSRTPHGLLDLATPAMAALLLLGHFPPLTTIVLGLVTAFAGYNAVYALNDLVDYKVDQQRIAVKGPTTVTFHVDEILVRHPIARGLLEFRSGLNWFVFWAVLAIVGAWILNPVCAILFVASAVLETIYCKLLRISHLKILPSALVKATGGLAGIFAVNPYPPWSFVAVVFIWLAAWEIGGQNIPNDLVDREDDSKVGAKTTVTVKGLPESVFRIVAAASMAFAAGVVVYWTAGQGVGPVYPIGAVAIGWFLLLDPARKLYYESTPVLAASLFNRASYVPVSFLALTIVSILVRF
jgi:4-hydroxybenzoate polyprenyltransferase